MERTLPPKFKNVVELEFHRKLTTKERWKLATGWNLIIRLKMLTQHKPGIVEPALKLELTEHGDSNGVIQAEAPIPTVVPLEIQEK